VTLLKVISWRVISISITLAITLAFSGNIKEATELTFIIHSFLVVFHWLFEKGWERLLDSQ